MHKQVVGDQTLGLQPAICKEGITEEEGGAKTERERRRINIGFCSKNNNEWLDHRVARYVRLLNGDRARGFSAFADLRSAFVSSRDVVVVVVGQSVCLSVCLSVWLD